MRYPAEAQKWPPSFDVPESVEMRSATKQRILDMVRAGDLDEDQACRLIAELGLGRS